MGRGEDFPAAFGFRNGSGKDMGRRDEITKAGIELFPVFSAHTFRHTFATRCIEAGILPKTVQKYLGHATLQMTMDLYVHVTEEFKQKELEKLDMVFVK